MNKSISKQIGFTIVELLVVIVVIGILAAITIVSYTGISQKAAVATIKSDLTNASTRLGVDNATNGYYPISEAAANDGKGLPKSNGTTYQYALATNNYCLGATSTAAGTSYRFLSTNGSIEAGVCNYSQTLAANLLSYWDLDESSGNVNDSAGGYTGTNTGVTFSAGKINNGGVFNGTTSYIDMPTSTNVTFADQITVSAWVKPASVVHAYTDRGIVTKNGALGEVFLLTHLGDPTGLIDTWGGFVIINSSEKWITSTTHPVAGTWYYVVMTYDGANQKMYVNGVLETTISMTGSITNHVNEIVIGLRSLSGTTPSRVFNGTIDEVGLWTRALSASEITTLYNAGSGLQYP